MDISPLEEKDRGGPELKPLESPSKKTSTNVSNNFDQSNLRESRLMKSTIFDEANHMYILADTG